MHQLLTDDGRLGFHQIERMNQYLAALGGIDQGRADPQLGAGRYGDEQFRAIFDVDGDGVAFLQADGGQIICQPVGPGIELLVGKLGVLVNHCSTVGIHASGSLDGHTQAQRLGGVSDLGHPRALDQAWQIADHLGNLGQKLGQRDDVGVAHRISISLCSWKALAQHTAESVDTGLSFDHGMQTIIRRRFSREPSIGKRALTLTVAPGQGKSPAPSLCRGRLRRSELALSARCKLLNHDGVSFSVSDLSLTNYVSGLSGLMLTSNC